MAFWREIFPRERRLGYKVTFLCITLCVHKDEGDRQSTLFYSKNCVYIILQFTLTLIKLSSATTSGKVAEWSKALCLGSYKAYIRSHSWREFESRPCQHLFCPFYRLKTPSHLNVSHMSALLLHMHELIGTSIFFLLGS